MTAATSTTASSPGVALVTGPCSPMTGLVSFATSAISVASDAGLWTCTRPQSDYELAVLDYTSGAWTTVYTTSSDIVALQATSFDTAYIIGSDTTTWIGCLNVGQDGSSPDLQLLADLPTGTPNQIAAGADGTLWVIDTGGNAWSYADKTWTQNSSSGSEAIVFSSISVGSEDWIVGLGAASGQAPVAQVWKGSDGWQPLSIAADATGWLAACADGSLWFLTSTDLKVVPQSGETKSIDTSSLQSPLGWTAASQMIAYTIDLLPGSSEGLGIFPFAYGILDLPPRSWPSMNKGELDAYDHICSDLQIDQLGGIRALYFDLTAPFSSYQTDISKLTWPPHVCSEDDWSNIVTQLNMELTYVISVNSLFSQLAGLNTDVTQIQSDEATSIQTQIGIDDAKQGGNQVNLVFSALVSTALTHMGSLFPPPGGFALSLIGSVLNAMWTQEADSVNSSGPSGSISMEFSKMMTFISNFSTQSLNEQETQRKTILMDWGKLSSAGEAISRGIWTWPATYTSDSIQSLSGVWDLYFFQAFMTAAWQIGQGWALNISPTFATPAGQDYTYMYLVEPGSEGSQIDFYYACEQLGTTSDLFTNSGPWPTAALLNAIFALGVEPSDFFSNQNGWNMQVVQTDNWYDPPSELEWYPYVPG